MSPSLRRATTAVLALLLSGALGCATSSRPATPAPPPRGSASIYLPGRTTPQVVHFAIVNGVAVMGGDILLGPVEGLADRYGPPSPPAAPGDHVSSAFATSRSGRLWSGGVIPFAIDPSVSPALQQEIYQAIDDINRTRLHMRPATAADKDHVVFNAKNHAGVCDSYLGRIGGAQPIRVGGCGRSTIVHEIMHAAGFEHEHQRPDRDGHITIVWENIDPAHHVHFERLEEGIALVPYDYGSVMHYRTTAFSRNGKPTIVPRVPNVEIRNYPSLSPGDVAAIDRLYADAGPAPVPTVPGGFPIGGLPIGFPIPNIPGLGELPGVEGWGLPGLPVELPPDFFGPLPPAPPGWPDLGTLLGP